MNNKPVSDQLIERHRYTLQNLYRGSMRWFAASRGESTRPMTSQELQSARIMAEQYWNRFEQEAETLLCYLRANGDVVISGPEDSAFKRDRAGHENGLEGHRTTARPSRYPRVRSSTSSTPRRSQGEEPNGAD
jgi:hypothetical protein